MIKFWERFVIYREKADNHEDKIYEYVFTKNDLICEICYTPMTSNAEITKHIKQIHYDLIDNPGP